MEPSERLAQFKSQGHDLFVKWHDAYLSVGGVNVIVGAAVLAMLTHIAVVVSSQPTPGPRSTVRDVVEGPGIIIMLAGIAGLAILVERMWVPSGNKTAVYTTFGIISLGLVAWSLMSTASDVGAFQMQLQWSLAGLMIVGFAVLSFVVAYMSGTVRLDAMSYVSIGAMSLAFVSIVLSYLLSKVFSLLIQTVEYARPELGVEDELGAFVMYCVGVAIMTLIISWMVRGLDFLISLFAGHVKPVIPAVKSETATQATFETMRALKLALYTIVLVTAALMWRRRKGIPQARSEAGLADQWNTMAISFVVIPLVAGATELLASHIGQHPALYNMVRAVALAVLLIYIGTSYIPWNFLTLSVAGAIAVIMGHKLVERGVIATNRTSAAFMCAALFVAGNYFFRGADKWLVDSGYKSSFYQTAAWIGYVVVPSILLFVATYGGASLYLYQTGERYETFKVYLSFLAFYTLAVLFGDTMGAPGPYYEVVPQNEAASLAVDGLLLTTVIILSTTLWEAVVPIEFVQGGGAGEVAGILITGMASAYLFTSVRTDPDVIAFVSKGQTESEEWYLRFIEDSAKP